MERSVAFTAQVCGLCGGTLVVRCDCDCHWVPWNVSSAHLAQKSEVCEHNVDLHTQTIDSIPLITASIISKKAAEGLHSLILDVKCGTAAFMKTKQDATELAESMVAVARGLGIKCQAQITAMDNPIGSHIGNSLEVIESVEILRGNGHIDTRNLVVMQGSALLLMANVVENINDGEV